MTDQPNPNWVTVAEPIWLPTEYVPEELEQYICGGYLDFTTGRQMTQIPHDKVLEWVESHTTQTFDQFLEEASKKVEQWPAWKRVASGVDNPPLIQQVHVNEDGSWRFDTAGIKLKRARKLVAELIRTLRHKTTVRFRSTGMDGGLEFSCESHDKAKHQHNYDDKSQRFIAIEVLDLVHQLKRDIDAL
jgi:hypothetical protein